MIGHEVTLHETNSHGIVPICECEWIGAVHPATYKVDKVSGRARRLADLTRGLAFAEHGRHLLDVRADVARQSDRALVSHGRLIHKVNDSSLVHRGRFGTP